MGQSYDIEMEKRRLKLAAYRLRQDAIEDGNFEGWRVARLVRDASTIDQIREAHRRLDRLRRSY